tara:strand:+ start:1191 stop:2147 length:957 start_codon:yes stop_codon:yes gene_type:complete
MNYKTYLNIILIALFLIISNSMYVIDEKQQAIVTQFGKPVGEAKTESGLHFKIPFIQTVIKFDKRILEWDGAANEIPTKDNKYIFIDTFARWKISDALQFYKSAKNEILAQSRLDDVIDGAVRDEISNRYMSEIIRSSERTMETYESEISSDDSDLLSAGARIDIIQSILLNVSNKLSELNLGIQVVDVQMKRVSYNLQVQEKLFNRMISEQNMIAEKYRAQGQGKKQEILGKQIQKEKQIMSNSYLESQKIKGRADAEATAIYADAYCNLDLSTNKCKHDVEFYNYYMSLETYKETLDPTTLFILSTDNKYLRYLEK